MKALVWIVILGVLGGGAYWYFKRDGASAKIEYRTAPITKGDVTQIVTANGTLNPVVTVNVGSQVSGLITKLYADHNSKVTNGQLIVELDPATYEARVIQAKGDLSSATAQLHLAEVNTKRAKELLENKLIAQSDYDSTVAELEQRQASVEVRKASLKSADVDLSRAKIYSPIDGTVINRAVDVGQTVQASFSAPTLFLIANDLAQMEISAMVSEADIGGVETNQDVSFTVEAFPSRTFRGIVSQVRNQPTTNQNVVAYATIVQVRNDDLKLKPGMTANVSITTAKKQNALKVSNAALRFAPPKDAFVNTNVIKLASATNAPAGAGAMGAAVDDGLPAGIPPEFRKRMLERYDKNGDGKVDADERKAMEEERERRRAAGGGGFGGGGGGGGGGFGGGGPGGGGFGGMGGGGQRPRELPPFRNIYLVSTNTAVTPARVELQPVQIRIGITDGLNTEILEGVDEGAVVAIGSIGGAPVAAAGAQSNPFGGPFGGGPRGGGGGGGRGGGR